MRSKFSSYFKRNRCQIPISLLALGMILSAGSASGADADTELKLGQRLFARNHYREAIKCFDRAIKQNPRLDYAYGLRGGAHLELEERQAALDDFNRAISINSTIWSYYESRSRLKYEKDDLDGAILDVTRALQLNPKGDHLYRLRSKYYVLQKRDDKALADLNKSIEVQRKGEEGSYRNRGDLYFRLKKYDLAVKDYTLAINASLRKKNDNDMEQQYSARANAYEKLGKKDLAAADRKKVQAAVKDGWGAFLYEGNK